MQNLNRHRFLAVAGKSALATAVGPALLMPKAALAASFVREDVGSLTATSPTIVAYANAVAVMQARKVTDPTSWAYQAAIHGTYATPLMQSWNTCEHGTKWFWSWHRMYLYWFERIVRKASGSSTWALPYWAWDSGEVTLPPMFRDTSSALYTPNRDPNMNSAAGSLPAGDVAYASDFGTKVYSTPNQTGANDLFQNTPHGAVHVDVGGWMGDIYTAGQDPIFYLHHANCDRLWQVWRSSYGGSDPLTDATWTSKTYTFFDENGLAVTMTACQILNAAQQLGYTYQTQPALTLESCVRTRPSPCPVRFVPFPPFSLKALPPLGDEPVSVRLPISPEARKQLLEFTEKPGYAVYLKLEGVEADRQPGAVWATNVGPAAITKINFKSPSFVGNVVLFGTGIREVHSSMFRPAVFAFKLNEAIRASLRSGDSLTVTFAPHGVLVDGELSHRKIESPVTIGKISITVEIPCLE